MATEGKILVLDDDEDFLALVAELFREDGIACVAVSSFAALVARREEAVACRAAILDINLGAEAPNGLEALRWLKAQGFPGRIVILTGHARRHPLVRRACEEAGVEVLEKPVDVATLEAIAKRAA